MPMQVTKTCLKAHPDLKHFNIVKERNIIIKIPINAHFDENKAIDKIFI